MSGLIFVLSKPRSKQKIEVESDYSMDPDGWFKKISFIEKKTGKVSSTHCVIEKDLDRWIQGFVSEGWVIEFQQ